MVEVRFYHLQSKTLEQALPPLLTKALGQGLRAVVMAGSDERVETLNQWLWTWDAASFLPHGSRQDGSPAEQPIWLTTECENPNGARLLVLTDGAGAGLDFEAFGLVCDLFDGKDPAALAAARERWRSCKAAGHAMTYWQQSATDGWERKS